MMALQELKRVLNSRLVQCMTITVFILGNIFLPQEVLVLDEADRLLDMGFEARYT